MKKIIYLIVLFLMFFTFANGLYAGGEEKKEEKKELPKIGSIYKYSGADWFVRGVGDKAFEYKSTGESLCIITIGIQGSIVKVPKKGEVVRVDPEVPMIYLNKKEDKELKNNTYFMKKAKNKVFILLEYIRK